MDPVRLKQELWNVKEIGRQTGKLPSTGFSTQYRCVFTLCLQMRLSSLMRLAATRTQRLMSPLGLNMASRTPRTILRSILPGSRMATTGQGQFTWTSTARRRHSPGCTGLRKGEATRRRRMHWLLHRSQTEYYSDPMPEGLSS